MLNALLDQNPDWLFLLQPSLLIVEEAAAPEVRLGHPPLAGQLLSKVVPALTPEDVEALLQGQHDPHPDVPLRVRLQTAEGETVPADLRARRVEGGRVLASVRLLSERARIAERELVAIVCAAPAAILTWAPDGTLRSFNPAAERLFGVTAEEVLSQSVFTLMPETERAGLERRQQCLMQGEPVEWTEGVRLRRQGAALEAFDCEERLFLVRDVLEQVSSFGSVIYETGEVVRLRRATEALSAASPSVAAHAPGTASSAAMREAEELVQLAAESDATTVLLLGETGVGKTHYARRIHQQSARKDGAFLELNCASFDSGLMEAELFGYERGAFTGAVQRKAGLVEAAAGGTLFLDEVGELPLTAQAKLLTFLDAGTFRRVGAVVSHRSDARIIAATNADLAERVASGAFRQDLYYRLRVLPIRIPPLRERRQELEALVMALLRHLQPRGVALGSDVLPALLSYAWPGNVRELRNALERACLLARGGVVEKRHLPEELRAAPQVFPHSVVSAAATSPGGPPGSAEGLLAKQREHVMKVLAAADGNRSEAARRLGISRSTLTRKLSGWGEAK